MYLSNNKYIDAKTSITRTVYCMILYITSKSMILKKSDKQIFIFSFLEAKNHKNSLVMSYFYQIFNKIKKSKYFIRNIKQYSVLI